MLLHRGFSARTRFARDIVRNSSDSGFGGSEGGDSIHSAISLAKLGPIPCSSVSGRPVAMRSAASSGHKRALRAARLRASARWPRAFASSPARDSRSDRYRAPSEYRERVFYDCHLQTASVSAYLMVRSVNSDGLGKKRKFSAIRILASGCGMPKSKDRSNQSGVADENVCSWSCRCPQAQSPTLARKPARTP